jgi:hypothetical protein
MEVHALAPAPGGGLYVAHLARRQDLPGRRRRHVEDLLRSRRQVHLGARRAPDGALFAATGEKGNIYRITPDGKGSLFYKTNTTNVVALGVDKAATCIAGTESPGRIFRIDKDAKAFVLRRLAVQGNPRAEGRRRRHDLRGRVQRRAGRRGSRAPVDLDDARPPRAPVPAVSPRSPRSRSSTPVGVVRRRRRRQQPSRNAKGAIFRIRPDGLWDTLWEAADDWPFDLLIETDGSLLVGTGKEGKIFRLAGDPARATLLARARRGRSRAHPRRRGPHHRRHQQSRQGVLARLDARRDRHLRVRRARRRHGRDVGRDPLARRVAPGEVEISRARATRRRRTRHGAPGRRPTPSQRRADHSPERALPAVARVLKGRRSRLAAGRATVLTR